MLQLFNWPSAKTPDEIRAEIEQKRGKLADLQANIRSAKENADDALHDSDTAFYNYWSKHAQKLQAQATALDGEIAELAAQLPAGQPAEREPN